jgi:phosphatidylinositol alpha-1,6-mannosyltransferase
MRHLLVTNDFPPKTGGIQVYLEELWRRLDAGTTTVLTASSHPDAATFDEESSIVVERIPASTLFFPTPRALRLIEAAIERHNPDLVLLDPAWPLGLLGPRLSRPYGVILHGAEVTIPARLPLVASSLRYVLRHATVAIAAGGYPEAQARRNADDEMPPVVQVPPGVDIERFHPIDSSERDATRAALDIPTDALLVSSYSRLVPRKGMDTLIRASVRLAEEFPTLLVTIGGSGRDKKRLERLATRLNAPVRFLGRVDDAVLPSWLASSDVMVMDCRSRWLGLEQEGFGIVFVEAAACGVPQVAGRSGGSHEATIDGYSGIVVPHSKRVSELTHAMATLLRDAALREEYGRNARSLAEEQFSWTKLAAQLESGLSSVLGYDA